MRQYRMIMDMQVSADVGCGACPPAANDTPQSAGECALTRAGRRG
jgi:hypothetical protein